MKYRHIKQLITSIAIGAVILSIAPVPAYSDEIIPDGIKEEILTEQTEEGDTPENTDDIFDIEGDAISEIQNISGNNEPETENISDPLNNASEDNSDKTGPVGGFIQTDPGYDIPISTPVQKRMLLKSSNLPSYYNLYEDNKLPAIKNQNPYNTCWAFSTIGALESNLSLSRNDPLDLSELHLAYYGTHTAAGDKNCNNDTTTSTSRWLDNGGNLFLAARTLANSAGPVAEADAPYTQAYNFDPSAAYNDAARMKNAYFINTDDTAGIKRAIMTYGGVAAAYYDSDESNVYNSDTYAYHCTENGSNHAVMLVGWDDNFSRDNFLIKPEGAGAWLVRNSWGQNRYSHSGYFWLSYYDSSFRSSGSVVAFEADTQVYDHCYTYAGQPISSGVYTAYGNVTQTVEFDVDAQEAIRAVSFELGSLNTTARVTVTNKKTGESVSASVHTSFVGIYTVEFNDPLEIPTDTTVKVSIEYTSDVENGEILIVCETENSFYYGAENVRFTGVCDKAFYLDTFECDCDPRVQLLSDDATIEYQSVTGISLNKEDLPLDKGEEGTLTATVYPENATDRTVTWSSSNEKIATVTSNGKVKGITAGSAIVTAKTNDGGYTATCNIWVRPTFVSDIILNSSSLKMTKGNTYKLTATVLPNDADNRNIIWDSPDKNVATVTQNGTITAVGKGTTLVTCVALDGSATYAACTVEVSAASSPTPTPTPTPSPTVTPIPTVTPVPTDTPKVSVKSVTLNKKTATLIKGKTLTLSATVKPANAANKKVTWKSSNTSVAKVSSKGVVTAKKAGKATITVTTDDGRKTAKCTITVKNPIKVKKIKLNKKTATIKAGKSIRLKASISPKDATNKEIMWKSSNKKIATVDKNGKVKCLKKGKVTITATAKDGSKKKATCKITVK